MGKRKIAIERVEDVKRYVTFSKRKKGLFSKASTACEKYGSEIAIILFSPTGKPYVFGPVDSLIDRFLHHQSSSSFLIPHPNFLSGTNSGGGGGGGGGTTTDHDHNHIEGGKKKRSRSCCRDDNGDDLIAEREMKKRRLSMITEAAEEEGGEKEGFLLTSSETEEGLMKNEFMGVLDHCCSSLSPSPPPFASSLVSDDELNETLLGFADYISGIDDHQHVFDMLPSPHQGVVYDEDHAFPFSDNWATIDVQDQLLS